MKWRRFNIGADTPEKPGLFFSWGNVEGHAIDSGYDFSQITYESTPGSAISADLSLEEDAANVLLGGNCRMPTAEEFEELVDGCNAVYTTLNGAKGYLLTSKTNGQVIFFPAPGRYEGTVLSGAGSGYIWSKTFSGMSSALGFNYGSGFIVPHNTNPRRYGFNIRAVLAD